MLLKKHLANHFKYPQSSFEVENLKNAAFNANRDRILSEHSRTSSMLELTQEKLQAILLETQETRKECERVTKGYGEAIKTIDQQFTELAIEEDNRIQHQSFIDQFNAGKPIGFFKLPSMLTRLERPRKHSRRTKSLASAPDDGLEALLVNLGDQAQRVQIADLQIECNVKQTIDKGRKGMSALLRPEGIRLGSLVPKGKTVPIVLP